jgi:predicted Zn-dependent protease with MMP-like domain
MPYASSMADFNAIIDDTLEELPALFQPSLEYTLIVVDDGPPGPLFGLYHGAPATLNPTPSSFETITLYKRTLESVCRSEVDLRWQVRKTLLHEIGHHFGLHEDEVRAASYSS